LSPEWNPGDLQLGKETLQPGRSCTPADRGNHFGQHQNIETIALDACTNLVSRRPWVTALGGARLTIYELSLHYRNKTQPNTNLKYSKLIKIPPAGLIFTAAVPFAWQLQSRATTHAVHNDSQANPAKTGIGKAYIKGELLLRDIPFFQRMNQQPR
jgi:hypothetical protein